MVARGLGWEPNGLAAPLEVGSSPVTHNSQEHEEEVNEVEVKRQRTPDRFLGVFVGAFIPEDIHFLDFLRIVRGQPNKDKHPGVGDDPV